MNDLIQRIVNAMIRQEGRSAVSTNPGDLRGAPWLTKPVIQNGFWVPSNRQIGIAGLAHLIALHIAQGNSLRDLIAGHPGVYAGFAPAADHNDTESYISHVTVWAAINSSEVPLFTFIVD